jgi:F-type H+-transporting ATPase subunit b
MGLGKDLPLWLQLLLQSVNFVILAGALVYFLRKPLKEYLQSRHQTIKERLGEAERLLREAAQAKAAYEEKLSKLEAEIDAFRTRASEDTEKERKRILEEAHGLASRIREQAHLAYEQEMREAVTKIRAEIAERTIRAAEQKVRQTFGKNDHDLLVEEFIRKVRSTN